MPHFLPVLFSVYLLIPAADLCRNIYELAMRISRNLVAIMMIYSDRDNDDLVTFIIPQTCFTN